MAWPLTPLTTYLLRGLPPIKAADLNAIQTAINRNFLGTYSQAGLVLDGTGGQDVAPPAGSLTASGSISCLSTLDVSGNASFKKALNVGGDAVIGGNGSVGGLLKLAGRGGGTSVPTPAVQQGAIYADSVVAAFGSVAQDGRLIGGFGVKSVAHLSTGFYSVTVLQPAPQALVPLASISTGSLAVSHVGVNDRSSFTLDFLGLNGDSWQRLDAYFQFVVFAV